MNEMARAVRNVILDLGGVLFKDAGQCQRELAQILGKYPIPGV
jgi:hypothetical protein